MKKQHWLGAIALIASAGLVLTGCSNGNGNGAGGEAGGKTLTIASTATDKAAVEAAIAAFTKANEGVEIKATYADTDAYHSTLRTQLPAGTAPDVFGVWPGNGNPSALQVLVKGGFVKEQSDAPWAGDVPAGFDSVTKVDGKRYIFPVSLTGIGAIYNEKAVSDAQAKIPTTWTEMLAFCTTAKDAGKVAFALGNQTPWVTQLANYALASTLVFQADPEWDAQHAAGKTTFQDSAWKTTFEKYLEMNTAGCFNANPLGTSVEASQEMVAKGDALAIIQVTAVLQQIADIAPEGTTFGMFAVPATDNAADTWMPGAAGLGYGVNAKAKNPELAQKFLNFLAEPAQVADYATAVGALPAMPTDSYQVPDTLKVLVDFQDEGRTYPFMDQLWPNAKVQQTHLDGIQKVFAGTASIDEVLTAMQKAYDDGQ